MSSSLTMDELIMLGKYRWAVPLLADLAAHGGARFVELLHRLAISRDSLTRTLQGAMETGWVLRNPGHGHPLRPEYILTTEGERIAASAAQIRAAQRRIGIGPVHLTRWSLPIVRTIADGRQRFNEIARALPESSPRALSQGLQALTGQALVERRLVEGFPPGSVYTLTKGGVLLAGAG
jgi:DNA-binding HxlR family transcriptional regulator